MPSRANTLDAVMSPRAIKTTQPGRNAILRAHRPAPPPPSSSARAGRLAAVNTHPATPNSPMEYLISDESSADGSSDSHPLHHTTNARLPLQTSAASLDVGPALDRMPYPHDRPLVLRTPTDASLATLSKPMNVPALLALNDEDLLRTTSYIQRTLWHFSFNVGPQYKVCDVIGEGAYGIVCSAIHKPTGRKVAIKKIQPFEHQMFALRTLREMRILKHFQESVASENIITILDIVKPFSFDSFSEVLLIQELMETDLHRVIRSQQLSDDHCQYFIYQILRALKAMHSADVIHRDLKPSNLLLNSNCDLKVCDFGLARSTLTAEPSGGETGYMTEYVATRWYRAPEIMLTLRRYSKAIDIWAVGCILAEMLTGRPLFPGRDYHNQMSLILDLLGTPTMEEFYGIASRRSRDYIRSLPFRKKKDFAYIFPAASPDALDFLHRTLAFDPKRRLTAEQALAHPYLAAYHDPDDEPTAPTLDPALFDFDLQKATITTEALKEEMWRQVQEFTPLI